jgi:hypothetical protein
VRSNSVKKPTSFKSVSVTKNFLAKSAVSTPAARPGEKVAPAGQTNTSTLQTAKPRLVAKSGSGIGNVPRSSLSKVNGSGSGPDASKVWNKNQPVPPPPPKHFTDEELKQQYGIHLATRLQADEGGKEAKWADIDDDEDDWAPDTVQWMDGTKSTVATTENQPPPEDPKAVLIEPPAEAPKPTPTAASSQKPSSTGGSKTILKPGAHAQPSSGKSGLVLKGQPEKPTLVAKPSAPTPVKSPWAALPPVDKVSPIPINPPAQPPAQSRFSQRESHAYDGMHQALSPAKEIAPDDFNRSWRDERGSRELFNSHSGRYEPVNEMRRGSVRDNFRQQPSVLQRPSQDGPAEPSAAFQTSRNSAEGPTWGRRRNSSNVSGGSGRRMSIDRRAPDLPPMPMNVQRRESHSTNGADAMAPGTPRPVFAQKAPLGDQQQAVPEQRPVSTQLASPNLSNVQPTSPYGSVASSGLQDATAPAPPVQAAPPVQVESAVEVQNRLMREKIERARLHKQQEKEAEEKEEAERKERLRKKLEAMGVGNEAKSKTKEQSPARPAEKSPQKDHALPAAVQSPPKPPVPTSEGEVAQYGMMKVHQPHPVKKSYHPEPVTHKPLRGPESVPKPSPSPVKAEAEVHPKPAGTSNETLPQPPQDFTRENKAQNEAPREQSQSRAPSSEAEARTGSHNLKPVQPPQGAWSSTSLPRQSAPWGSNVWGPPPTKDRALGNGIFDPSYNRGQPRSGPQQLPAQPQPAQTSEIGLNPSMKVSTSQPQAAPGQSFAQQTMFTKNEPVPAQTAKAASRPGPIAPPTVKGAWGNFATAIRRDDQALVAKNQEQLKRMGGETFRPEIREKFTDQQGKSQQTLHSKIGGPATLPTNGMKPEASTPPEPKPKDDLTKSTYANVAPASDAIASQPSVNQSGHMPPSGPAARSSRFFPRASEAAAQTAAASSKTDFSPPPPPETEAHPAFTGSSAHPVVKMPKPSPRVRLPPAAVEPATAPEAPVTMPPRSRFAIGARPLALDPEWQARFNSLLDKSPSAAAPVPMPKLPNSQSLQQSKPGALAIAASSKAPLDVRGTMASATVSLPNSVARRTFAEDTSSEVTTRVPAEEVLLEDREFGSLPIVKTPKVPHLAANERPVGLNAMRPNSRWPKQLVTTTRPILTMLEFDRGADGIDVRIRFGNMREAITKTVTRKFDSRKSPAREKPARYSPRGGRGRGQPMKAGGHRTTPPAQARSYHMPKTHTVAPTTS